MFNLEILFKNYNFITNSQSCPPKIKIFKNCRQGQVYNNENSKKNEGIYIYIQNWNLKK